MFAHGSGRNEGVDVEVFAGIALIATCAVAAVQHRVPAVEADRRASEFPTAKQFAESKEAQQHVAAAMTLASPIWSTKRKRSARRRALSESRWRGRQGVAADSGCRPRAEIKVFAICTTWFQ